MVLPFWIQAATSAFDSGLTSSRVAEFVLFISGAAIAFVHFFLASKCRPHSYQAQHSSMARTTPVQNLWTKRFGAHEY